MNYAQKLFLGAAGWFFMAATSLIFGPDKAMAEWQVGPSLSLSVSERYDDNIGSEDDPIEDAVTSLRGQFRVDLKQNVTTINLGTLAIVEFFSNNPDFNNPSFGAFANINQPLSSRTTISVNETLQYTSESVDFVNLQQDITQPKAEIEVIIRTEREYKLASSSSLAVSHQSSPRTKERLSYSYRLLAFEDPGLVDSSTHRWSGSISHSLSRSDSVSGRYEYVFHGNKGGRNSQIHKASMGLDHSFSQQTKGEGNVSLNYSIEPTAETFTTGGRINLLRGIGQLFTMKIGYTVTVSPSQGVSEDLVRYQTSMLSIEGDLSRNAQVTASGSYTRIDSISTEAVEIRSWNVSTGITYMVQPWIEMIAFYRHANQDSRNEAGLDIRRNQYIASLVFTFE